jgi:hypothetical protein
MEHITENNDELQALIQASEAELDEVQIKAIADALEGAKKAKTQLGRKLWALRAKIIASGAPLLDAEGIRREVAERRAGRIDE